MTEQDLKEIRERCEKATKGPWEYRNLGFCDKGKILGEYEVCNFGDEGSYYDIAGEPPEDNDLQFILHARFDLPRLLDAYESAEMEIKRLQQALQIYGNKDNWIEDCGEKYNTVFAFDCPFSVDNCTDIDEEPWLLARKALAGDNE